MGHSVQGAGVNVTPSRAGSVPARDEVPVAP